MKQNNFPNILKYLRSERNIGQEKLAECLNLSKGIISLWETGKREPTMNSLIKIAKFFEVSVDYLVGLED